MLGGSRWGISKIGSAGIWTIITKELSRIAVGGGIKYFQLLREGRKLIAIER